MVLPPDGTARAARRWMHLLSRSAFEEAIALIRADSAYSDLSQTQYAAALDWLAAARLVEPSAYGPRLVNQTAHASAHALDLAVFSAAIEYDQPAWLVDADSLVIEGGDIPADAAGLAECLGIVEADALLSISQIYGKIDLAARSRVGAAGELALVAMLETRWPGSVNHRALTDDGLGYDIAFTPAETTWHLEVKSTTRRASLAVHLSRHENNVARLDPAWRLIAVGLGERDELQALATAKTHTLLSRAPKDRDPRSTWDSVRHLLVPEDLDEGMPFLEPSSSPDPIRISASTPFHWMPS